VVNGRGLIYTVEEVSDLLGIPRPTLYRYLREYSIPHLRRSGKISIPEESSIASGRPATCTRKG
jgi:excisionase family DNA binding protein